MKILAINAGSSSLKYQLFNMPGEEVLCSGIAERIGVDGVFSIKVNGEKVEEKINIPNHSVAVDLIVDWFKKYDVIHDMSEISGVGHRVVHGGENFSESVIITNEVKAEISKLAEFAPLHNPAHILGIEGFEKVLPNAIAVAVFDTAFHQTMPEESYMYAVPREWYKAFGVRKYGFHGTSHMYVSEQAAELLGKPYTETKTIVCHLGNGASICAVKNGKSYDTSMGFTPLAGIPMGTRSGDIDPAIIPYIAEKLKVDAATVVDLLNKKSGFLGMSELSNDARDLEDAVVAGNHLAALAVDIYSKKIAEFVAGYFVSMGGADIIAFTAGIGENSGFFRTQILNYLTALGIVYDADLNNSTRGTLQIISTNESKINVAVIPTNEEVVIARDTYKYI